MQKGALHCRRGLHRGSAALSGGGPHRGSDCLKLSPVCSGGCKKINPIVPFGVLPGVLANIYPSTNITTTDYLVTYLIAICGSLLCANWLLFLLKCCPTETMKEEIAATVVFITRMVKKKNEKLSKQKIEKFGSKLTKILFEKYKNHWYLETPPKGQAYRCIRVNKSQPLDPVLLQACVESRIEYSSLELPKEFTIWVDPCEVWCRCGEKNQPFIVTRLEEHNKDSEIFQHISSAAERATSDYYSGTSSDEESYNKESNTISVVNNTNGIHQAGEEETFEMKTIPIVSNPNSIYQLEGFREGDVLVEEPQTIPTVINPKSIYQNNDNYPHSAVTAWPRFIRKKTFLTEDYNTYPPQKGYRTYRVFTMVKAPRVDRYHWVNTKR